MKQKVPECGVLKACLDLLAAERIWAMRINSGGFAGEHKGKKRFVRFAQEGMADILATPNIPTCFLFADMHCLDGPNEIPWTLWIECKSDSGKQTPEQKSFEQEVTGKGHIYLLVRDVDRLRDWLKEHGVKS